VQTRRRLSLIAGMVLSTVIIAAPAAQADDSLSPRQDCSKTRVQNAHRGGVVGDIFRELFDDVDEIDDVLINSRQINENIRTTDVGGDEADITVDDSFNCSNVIDRSFREKRRHDHRNYGHGRHDWNDKR
jgi:hypothetical protein